MASTASPREPVVDECPRFALHCHAEAERAYFHLIGRFLKLRWNRFMSLPVPTHKRANAHPVRPRLRHSHADMKAPVYLDLMRNHGVVSGFICLLIIVLKTTRLYLAAPWQIKACIGVFRQKFGNFDPSSEFLKVALASIPAGGVR